jgi:hypothetical protein
MKHHLLMKEARYDGHSYSRQISRKVKVNFKPKEQA